LQYAGEELAVVGKAIRAVGGTHEVEGHTWAAVEVGIDQGGKAAE